MLDFSATERAAILAHGPWPHKHRTDPTNRFAERPAAQAFGRQLFADVRLSAQRNLSCATCHDPARSFTDGRPQAQGASLTARNTPTLFNAQAQHWQGWSGATDSVWAASLRPLADPNEMGPAERVVVQRLREEPDLSAAYRRAMRPSLPADDDVLLADIGKALAAYQQTLVSPRTPFDGFRDALARGDRAAMARYPLPAQRGLRLFVGRARCALCHSGPLFTHGEFDQAGMPVRKPDGRLDWGRHEGVKALLANRFNLLSRHNDDPDGDRARGTRHVALSPESYGAFRVPSLREAAVTAPYMHDGSLPTLDAVVRHYAGLDEVKLHIAAAHGHAEPGAPLPPRPAPSLLVGLALSEQDIQDLVAFLETLAGRPTAQAGGPQRKASGIATAPSAARSRSSSAASGGP